MAIALFGLAAVGLSRALNMTARTASKTRAELEMLNKLQTALTEASKAARLEEGENVTEPDAIGITIKTEIIPMEELENAEGQQLQNMFHIRCTAYWEQNGKNSEIVAETYRYEPLYRPR